MTVPSPCNLHDLGPQARMMPKHCNNERPAMILHFGVLVIVRAAAASPVMRDTFGASVCNRGRSR